MLFDMQELESCSVVRGVEQLQDVEASWFDVKETLVKAYIEQFVLAAILSSSK